LPVVPLTLPWLWVQYGSDHSAQASFSTTHSQRPPMMLGQSQLIERVAAAVIWQGSCLRPGSGARSSGPGGSGRARSETSDAVLDRSSPTGMVNPANPKRAAASMLPASRDARGGHLAPHRGSVGSYSRAMGAAAAAVMAAVSGSTEDTARVPRMSPCTPCSVYPWLRCRIAIPSCRLFVPALMKTTVQRPLTIRFL